MLKDCVYELIGGACIMILHPNNPKAQFIEIKTFRKIAVRKVSVCQTCHIHTLHKFDRMSPLRHGRSGQAQLAYLAVGKGGTTVLGKFGFDPLAVKRLPRYEPNPTGERRHLMCANFGPRTASS
jgi:hypothetical protein